MGRGWTVGAASGEVHGGKGRRESEPAARESARSYAGRRGKEKDGHAPAFRVRRSARLQLKGVDQLVISNIETWTS